MSLLKLRSCMLSLRTFHLRKSQGRQLRSIELTLKILRVNSLSGDFCFISKSSKIFSCRLWSRSVRVANSICRLNFLIFTQYLRSTTSLATQLSSKSVALIHQIILEVGQELTLKRKAKTCHPHSRKHLFIDFQQSMIKWVWVPKGWVRRWQ